MRESEWRESVWRQSVWRDSEWRESENGGREKERVWNLDGVGLGEETV